LPLQQRLEKLPPWLILAFLTPGDHHQVLIACMRTRTRLSSFTHNWGAEAVITLSPLQVMENTAFVTVRVFEAVSAALPDNLAGHEFFQSLPEHLFNPDAMEE
jgi:hypothetical protein